MFPLPSSDGTAGPMFTLLSFEVGNSICKRRNTPMRLSSPASTFPNADDDFLSASIVGARHVSYSSLSSADCSERYVSNSERSRSVAAPPPADETRYIEPYPARSASHGNKSARDLKTLFEANSQHTLQKHFWSWRFQRETYRRRDAKQPTFPTCGEGISTRDMYV